MARFNIPLTITICSGVAWFFGILSLACAASFNIQRRNYNIIMNQVIEVSNPAANGMIAFSVFNMLWFGFFLGFCFWRPNSIFISMIVDTSFLGFLWLFSIATTGSMAAQSPYFSNCNNRGGQCDVGRAAIAFGFLTWFLITFLLALKVTYTLMHYGMSLDTWKTPFNELVLYGNKGSDLASGSGRRSRSRSSGAGAEEGQGQGQGSYQTPAYPQQSHGSHAYANSASTSGHGMVTEQSKMSTPASKPEMGEYFPVRQ